MNRRGLLAGCLLLGAMIVLAQAPQPVTTPQPSAPLLTVVLDAGHGGTDPGAVGPNLLKEKDLTLDLAKKIKAALSTEVSINVVLSRTDDTALTDLARVAIFNRAKPALMVSLHAGNLPGSANGFALFCERSAASAEPAQPATGDFFLWKEAQAPFLSESLKASLIFQENLIPMFTKLQPTDLPCAFLGVHQVPLAALEGAALPALVLELGSLGLPRQADLFKQESYKKEVAGAIASAIKEYFLKRAQ